MCEKHIRSYWTDPKAYGNEFLKKTVIEKGHDTSSFPRIELIANKGSWPLDRGHTWHCGPRPNNKKNGQQHYKYQDIDEQTQS